MWRRSGTPGLSTPAVPGRTPVGWGEPSAAPPAPRPGASDRRDVERPVAPVRRAFSVCARTTTTKGPPRVRRALRSAEDGGFEPPRAVNPTRFPSVRHRPLGESSWRRSTTHGCAPTAAQRGYRTAAPRPNRLRGACAGARGAVRGGAGFERGADLG